MCNMLVRDAGRCGRKWSRHSPWRTRGTGAEAHRHHPDGKKAMGPDSALVNGRCQDFRPEGTAGELQRPSAFNTFRCCLQLARPAVPSVLPAGTLKMHFWPEPLLTSACQWLPVCEEELSVMVLCGQPILPLHPQPLVPPTTLCPVTHTCSCTKSFPNPLHRGLLHVRATHPQPVSALEVLCGEFSSVGQ